MSDLVRWFAEAGGFEQGTKAPHKWVLQAEQELRIQSARIEELEAENARMNALCDQMKIGWGEDAVRAEAAEAKLATARNDALEEAAIAAEAWYRNLRKGMPHDEVRALKSTTQT